MDPSPLTGPLNCTPEFVTREEEESWEKRAETGVGAEEGRGHHQSKSLPRDFRHGKRIGSRRSLSSGPILHPLSRGDHDMK